MNSLYSPVGIRMVSLRFGCKDDGRDMKVCNNTQRSMSSLSRKTQCNLSLEKVQVLLGLYG
jgi:hypothetical protein